MPSCAAGERNGLPANSETTPARALGRRRTLQRRVPALWKRGRFRKGLGQSRKSGRCNLAGSGRDRRRSHPLRPGGAHGRRDETRQHEPTPESSEAASHMDGLTGLRNRHVITMTMVPRPSRRPPKRCHFQNASVPIPKFAHPRGTLRCELRNQRDTSNFMILVRHLDLKFLNELAAIMIGTSNPPH